MMDYETLRMDWLKLFHYFQHEVEEDEITEKTFDSMINALMTFKPKEEE